MQQFKNEPHSFLTLFKIELIKIAYTKMFVSKCIQLQLLMQVMH